MTILHLVQFKFKPEVEESIIRDVLSPPPAFVPPLLDGHLLRFALSPNPNPSPTASSINQPSIYLSIYLTVYLTNSPFNLIQHHLFT